MFVDKRAPGLAIVLVLLLADITWAGQKRHATPLGANDFRVGRIDDRMSSAQIRAALGPPLSVESARNFVDPDSPVITWHYDELLVFFVTEDSILGIELTGKKWETARGLHVGDSEAKVKRLYGNPTSTYSQDWDYVDQSDGTDLHVVRVTLEGGRVRTIFIGTLLD